MIGSAPRSRVLAGGRRGVAIGAAVLAALLVLPLAAIFTGAEEAVRWPVLVLGAIEVGLVAGMVGALLQRRTTGSSGERVRGELAGGLATVLGVAAGVALTSLASTAVVVATGSVAARSDALLITPAVLGVMAGLASAGGYALVRGLVLVWPQWNRLRRGRLLWAITHALLAASLTLAVGVAVLLIAMNLATGAFGARTYLPEAERAAAGPVEETVIWLTMRVAPSAMVLVLVSLVVGVVIVPPAALITFPVIRRATRRLEELANATAALRAGDLGTRIPVSGEDEIARLQTDFNAMAADLERSRDELRAERDSVARLLDDRRELIAVVSHELRTPVATLRGYLESAQARWEGEPPPNLRHDLAVMADETERLHRLIDDLFTLSRAEVARLPLTIEPTPVGSLLERAAGAAAPLAWERGRVEVIAQAAVDLPPVLADPARLEQVLRNLVNNAVRHTPPGGLVLLSAEADDGEVVISVRDTGEGIAAEDLPRVWDRFFRSAAADGHSSDRAEAREGSGLGLALVKELTEAMGGTVDVASVPDEGSCFSVGLPIATG